jgi:hypothetical protein
MALSNKQIVKKGDGDTYELHDATQTFTKQALKDERTRLKNLQKLDEVEVRLCFQFASNPRLPFQDQVADRLQVIEDLLKGADDADSM